MLGIIKKLKNKLLVTDKIKLEPKHNTELIELLKELMYFEELEAELRDPVNKMYLLNTYSSSFQELTDNLINRKFERQLIAIDMYSYMKGSLRNLHNNLERLLKLLETTKISSTVEHDLYEFINMCKMFKEGAQ